MTTPSKHPKTASDLQKLPRAKTAVLRGWWLGESLGSWEVRSGNLMLKATSAIIKMLHRNANQATRGQRRFPSDGFIAGERERDFRAGSNFRTWSVLGPGTFSAPDSDLDCVQLYPALFPRPKSNPSPNKPSPAKLKALYSVQARLVRKQIQTFTSRAELFECSREFMGAFECRGRLDD